MNSARACIFSKAEVFVAVSLFTCSLICAEASIRSLSRFEYQFPMPLQSAYPFFGDGPPAAKNEMIICPATPSHGGILGSPRIPLTSVTTHDHWLLPLWLALTSG